MAKKIVSYYIEDTYLDLFSFTAAANNTSLSSLIEGFIRDYCIENKAATNENILKLWEQDQLVQQKKLDKKNVIRK